ncbi:MFS transporter [Streptosporangium subroseum]|uniref:MFS transporter n=1 Tax=Streptosporangium subroseum TaxID=106412 RepID=UPI003089B419|nr:MFS transporter [Streptosporangium subroseum]
MTPTASALRVPRAIVFATLCIVVSAGGHALAGGELIPPHLGVLGTAIAFCVAYALNGRERGVEVVLAATAGTQLLLHELFSRATAPHTVSPAEHGHSGSGLSVSLSMMVIHVVVALGTGWWLHRGESALWLMIRLYGGRMPVIRLLFIGVAGVTLPVWQAVPAAEVRPYGGWEILPVLRRRGPPAARPAG